MRACVLAPRLFKSCFDAKLRKAVVKEDDSKKVCVEDLGKVGAILRRSHGSVAWP